MASRAKVLAPAEGSTLAFMGSELRFLVESADSDSRQAIVRYTIAANQPGPPLHRHAFDEYFYVMSGTLTFAANGEEFDAAAGASIYVPGGSPHTFGNRSGEPATLLMTIVPGGFENFFKEAIAAFSSTPPDQIMSVAAGLYAKYGIEVVGPPMSA